MAGRSDQSRQEDKQKKKKKKVRATFQNKMDVSSQVLALHWGLFLSWTTSLMPA